MAKDLLNYGRLVENALKGVVATALRRAAQAGLPGEHHFFISFRTDHPRAKLSPVLKAQYPHEMTIVLQHQYWGLEVAADGFEVTLSFNKTRERLGVPFAALTGFRDPSVPFALQFQAAEPPPNEVAAPAPAAPAPSAPPPAPPGDKVVSIDRFRKK